MHRMDALKSYQSKFCNFIVNSNCEKAKFCFVITPSRITIFAGSEQDLALTRKLLKTKGDMSGKGTY